MRIVLHSITPSDNRPRALAEAFGIGPGSDSATRAKEFATRRARQQKAKRKDVDDVSDIIEREQAP